MTPPRLLVLTDRHQARRPLPDVVRACVAGGARAVLLREKDLPPPERRSLARALAPVVAAAGGVLLVASDAGIPSDGVHLAADDAWPPHVPGLVGRSCHDRAELDAAAAAGCAYATLSPIHATASKPGHGPPLGPAALADPPLPTLALGGIDRPARAAACVAAGAHGVAVMGAAMRAEHPDRLIGALTDAVARPHAPPPTRQAGP